MNVVLRSRASTLSSAVSSLANTGISFTKVDEREKQAALEEEQARLKALKVVILLLLQVFRTEVSLFIYWPGDFSCTSSLNFALCKHTVIILLFGP